MSEDRDVIIIVVDPPRPGDPMWICHAEGHENLKDGGIYIRADGETRAAKGDEVDSAKTSRDASAGREPCCGGSGSALPCSCDDTLLHDHLRAERARLEGAYRRRQPGSRITGIDVAMASLTQAALVASKPEDRTHEEYLNEIADWPADARTAWPAVVDAAASYGARPMCLQIRNLAANFMEELQVRVHLEGPVRAVNALTPGDPNPLARLPTPPRAWGPRPRFELSAATLGLYQWPALVQQRRLGRPRNGVDESSTGETWQSNQNHLLVLPAGEEGEITGTWTVIARGHHEVFRGALTIPATPTHDLSAALRRLLARETSKSADDS
jgi:hypothetical protein